MIVKSRARPQRGHSDIKILSDMDKKLKSMVNSLFKQMKNETSDTL